MSWVGLLAAALGIIAALLQVWREARPRREAEKRRKQNAEIDQAVRSGNAGRVRDWLRRWRSEAD